MDIFTTLFGISASKIKNTCVLIPYLTREILEGLKIDKLSRGVLYSAGDNGSFSLIHTGIGSAFLGDAVLHLKTAPCKNLILFGSCGAVREDNSLGIGGIVIVKKSLVQDSFIGMLSRRKTKTLFYPDRNLSNRLLSFKDKYSLRNANCLTVSSLKLENQYLKCLKNNSIDIIDMETGPFFAASKSINKKSASVLFITDTLKSFPYYIALNKQNRPLLKNITGNASRTVYELLKKL